MAPTPVVRHGPLIGLDQTWGAAAYVSAREEAARHHGRLYFFKSGRVLEIAALGQPGDQAEPHPHGRQEHVEDEQPEREQDHPEGPVIDGDLRLHARAPEAASRRRGWTLR